MFEYLGDLMKHPASVAFDAQLAGDEQNNLELINSNLVEVLNNTLNSTLNSTSSALNATMDAIMSGNSESCPLLDDEEEQPLDLYGSAVDLAKRNPVMLLGGLMLVGYALLGLIKRGYSKLNQSVAVTEKEPEEIEANVSKETPQSQGKASDREILTAYLESMRKESPEGQKEESAAEQKRVHKPK